MFSDIYITVNSLLSIFFFNFLIIDAPILFEITFSFLICLMHVSLHLIYNIITLVTIS